MVMMFEYVLKQIAYDFGMQLEDLCFAVSTKDFDFPFSFFAFEDDNIIGVFVTDENGMEKIHVVVKSEIVYFRIHYLDEIESFMDDGDNDRYRRVEIHE